MVKISNNLKEKLKQFALELEGENVRVKELILYGSFANGTQWEHSDIDIAVVSDDFEGIPFNDYNRFIDSILKIDTSIEPVAYTSKLAAEDPFFQHEIRAKGIKII